MGNKKKIAVITPFLAQGGLEKVAVTGAKELEIHFDVTMIVFDTSRVDYPYDGKLIDLGIDFHNRNIFKRLFNLMKIIIRLRAIKRCEAFDLIIVHGELANLAAVFSGRGNHIVVIHENRFSAIKDIQSKLFSLVSKQIYHAKNTKKIVTVSQGIEKKFIEYFDLDSDKIETIYNPYDITTIQKSAQLPLEKYDELFDKNVLISVGRLSEAKGHRYLLQIYQLLRENRRDTKLMLLGDGELRDELIAYAKGLGLKVYSVFENELYSVDYDVYFIGFHSSPYQFIARANLFLMTSLWEGFGNTIVESMACGTPVISTDCPSGPREIIAPDQKQALSEVYFSAYGVVMPAFSIKEGLLSEEDKELWCKIMTEILDNKTIRQKYQKNGFKRAYDFDKQKIMVQWKNSVMNVLNNTRTEEEGVRC